MAPRSRRVCRLRSTDAIAKLPIPKVMSYAGPGHYFNNEKFVRPAHRLVVLHGDEVVPVTALGLTAGRTTQGHRFLSRGTLDLANAEAYAPTLEAEGKVIPSFAARRAQIVVALEGAAADATPIMPDALLDEVTALVEWPAVYAGTFDAAFLDVPQECLILTMQLNQRYFALADDAGKLANRFLLVSNLSTTDPSSIVAGNERVLRARLADAKFFFDQDRKQRLDARLPKLAASSITTSSARRRTGSARVQSLAQRIAPLIGADPALAAPRGDAREGRSRRPTWSASFRSCRGSWAATTRRTTASLRKWRPRSSSITGQRPRAANCRTPQSRNRSRSPTSSKRSPGSSASDRCRPATRTRSACAAQRSASCAS